MDFTLQAYVTAKDFHTSIKDTPDYKSKIILVCLINFKHLKM